MDMKLEDIISYVLIFVFIVLPRLLRLFTKKKGTQPTLELPELEEMLEEEEIPRQQMERDERPEFDAESLPAPGSSDLERSVQQLLDKARDIRERAGARGGGTARLVRAIESNCEHHLFAIARQLERIRDGGMLPTEEESYGIRLRLSKLEHLISVFEVMIEKRIHPRWSDLLMALDGAAEECFSPILLHARRYNLYYPTEYIMVVIGQAGLDLAITLKETNVAPAVVDESNAELPKAWANIYSDIVLDLYHSTRGLKGEIAAELGAMPFPMSISHYSNQNMFVSGLLSGWLPRIFADTGAALALGSGFAAGLAEWIRESEHRDQALTIRLGEGAVRAPLPAHVRMYIACHVLSRLGLSEEAASRIEQWNDLMEHSETFTVVDETGGTGLFKTSSLIKQVLEVVDYVLEEPKKTLGGYSLATIPGLPCGEECRRRMEEVRDALIASESPDEPARIVLGAAQLAVEKSSTHERNIAKAALNSLAGKGVKKVVQTSSLAKPAELSDMMQSRQAWARAMVLGAALTPLRSKRGNSRR